MYYNITIGGEGSTGTPNLYYVVNGRPLRKKNVLKNANLGKNRPKLAKVRCTRKGPSIYYVIQIWGPGRPLPPCCNIVIN